MPKNASGRSRGKKVRETDRALDYDELSDLTDPDLLPRPVVAVALDVDDWKLLRTDHVHAKGQLLYTRKGVATLETADGLWSAPPNSAVWIPPGVVHSLKGSEQIEFRFLYFDLDVCASLPRHCCILAVNPLLRELIAAFVELPALYPVGDTRASRLVSVLLDELQAARHETLHLPMPRDERLLRIARAMLQDPSLRLSIEEWGAEVGTSARSLARHFSDQTGMTFGKWRRQLQLSAAVNRLAKGESVTNIALDLGYESTSAFITMFKGALGQTPRRYMEASDADGGDR